jgi:hypothetical protein
MSLGFASEQLADLRHDAQRLVDRAGDQERQLDAFVAAAEAEVRRAEAAAPDANADFDVGEVRHLLSAHVERRAAGATVLSARRPDAAS